MSIEIYGVVYDNYEGTTVEWCTGPTNNESLKAAEEFAAEARRQWAGDVFIVRKIAVAEIVKVQPVVNIHYLAQDNK